VRLPAFGSVDARSREDLARPPPRTYDVLIGVNLLREGLDLPEVSLVAILDADKEGFLRSTGSLIRPWAAPRAIWKGSAALCRRDDRLHAPRHRGNHPPAYAAAGLQRSERNCAQSIIKPIDLNLVAIAEGDYVTIPLDTAEDDAGAVPPEQLDQYLSELEAKNAGCGPAVRFSNRQLRFVTGSKS